MMPQAPTTRGQNAMMSLSDIQNMLMILSKMNIRQTEDGKWYVESGTAVHVTGDVSKFYPLVLYHGKGSIVMEMVHITPYHIYIHCLHSANVLHVPNIKKNIVSVSKLIDNTNFTVEFTSFFFYLC